MLVKYTLLWGNNSPERRTLNESPRGSSRNVVLNNRIKCRVFLIFISPCHKLWTFRYYLCSRTRHGWQYDRNYKWPNGRPTATMPAMSSSILRHTRLAVTDSSSELTLNRHLWNTEPRTWPVFGLATVTAGPNGRRKSCSPVRISNTNNARRGLTTVLPSRNIRRPCVSVQLIFI